MKIYSKDENLYFHYLTEKEELQMNDNHVGCKKTLLIKQDIHLTCKINNQP